MDWSVRALASDIVSVVVEALSLDLSAEEVAFLEGDDDDDGDAEGGSTADNICAAWGGGRCARASIMRGRS